MILDIVIAAILLIALVIGYQRGVIQPLLAEILFLGTLLVILRERAPYTAAMSRYLHSNAVLDVFIALILAVVAAAIGAYIGGYFHRLPVLRGVDGLLGIFVHVAVATIIVYLGLSALVTLDKAFGPFANQLTLSLNDVNKLQQQILSNPLTAALVDPKELKKLQDQAKTPSGARLSSASQLNQVEQFYIQFLQPQLYQSRAVPVILNIGHRLPVIGRIGPSDLHPPPTPKPTPKPSGTPKPTASPTK
ncbi:MAG TPA: CvpA family protein [Candidatus Acidoferrales bacterium]|nr:CvpA family protein [Candidatus Acidoferrales bacterium]